MNKSINKVVTAIATVLFLAVAFLMAEVRAYAESDMKLNIRISSAGANMIEVMWDSAEGAESYNVYRCDKDSDYRLIASTKEAAT